MSIHFHALRIKEIQRPTTECVTIEFEVPDQLKDQFSFVQGQNLTLKTLLNGEEIRRSYSICSAPYENRLMVAVKKVEGGRFSTWANEKLRAGDQIEVLPPTGKFHTPLNPSASKNYLAFAAGSGITPILSILKTTLHTEPESRFTLVYVNRHRPSIIFLEELEALKNLYLQRFHYINLLTREQTDAALFHGRLDAQKLRELGTLIPYAAQDEVYICGPETMIFCVKDYLQNIGIPDSRIHFELFSSMRQPAVNRPEAGNQSGEYTLRIISDGRSFEFSSAGQNSILDDALAQGADLPYACKGGMCCTCKARLLEGRVEMNVTWGLEPDEISKGFILTCQAHPVTERVVVDFDTRG